jgi:hypothetical protein
VALQDLTPKHRSTRQRESQDRLRSYSYDDEESPVTKVFFGGSRGISRLSAEIRERIENVLGKGFTILIGDANGADKAIQKHLAENGYRNVTVFCSGTVCRNNLGNWSTRFVTTDRKKKDFLHYAKKDAEMGNNADYGFFLWDQKSKGTLNNILGLVNQNKAALVYLSPKKTFVTIKDIDTLNEVVEQCDPHTAKALRQVLSMNKHVANRQSHFDLA